VRLGRRFFAAVDELIIAGRWLPFLAAGAAVAGSMLQMLLGEPGRRREDRLSALLIFLVSAGYVGGVMATLPWFGQEDRYLLPVHPFAIVLVGMLIWFLLARLPLARLTLRPSVAVSGMLGLLLLLVGGNYLWATRNYAVEVRNIEDAHVKPALWLAQHTPANSIIASEPIGAVKLLSQRRTVDLVGLTSPEMLTTYRDWPVTWRVLRDMGADYMLYYPAWFGRVGPPQWAVERAQFPVPDNRIAGDKLISIYELDWTRYREP
jgi:hypothetical protein